MRQVIPGPDSDRRATCEHEIRGHRNEWDGSIIVGCKKCGKTSGEIARELRTPSPAIVVPIEQTDLLALERIAKTRFCREYDTFAAMCPNRKCCGEVGHDHACGPCADHTTLRDLIAKARSEARNA